MSVDGSALVDPVQARTIHHAKRMAAYLSGIPTETHKQLFGIIFAAACDFSKATRDVLHDWARTDGISESHLWGKGEIEDQLFQPKNDIYSLPISASR